MELNFVPVFGWIRRGNSERLHIFVVADEDIFVVLCNLCMLWVEQRGKL